MGLDRADACPLSTRSSRCPDLIQAAGLQQESRHSATRPPFVRLLPVAAVRMTRHDSPVLPEIRTMTPDARNSILLWAGGIGFLGVFWAGLQFDLFRGVSSTWLGTALGVVGIVQLIRFGRGLWQRRASNPANPNKL